MMAEGENIFMIKECIEQSAGSWKGTWIALKNNLRCPLELSVWAEDKHEKALGTRDPNRCEKNNCECNWVGYTDFSTISLICFRESTYRLFSISLSAEYPPSFRDWVSGFLGRFTLSLNALKLQEQSQQLLCGLCFHSFIHQPHIVTVHCPKALPNIPTNVGSRCSVSPGNLEVYVYLFFVVCIIQELKTDSRKCSRLVVERASACTDQSSQCSYSIWGHVSMKSYQKGEVRGNSIDISWKEFEKHLLDRASDSGQGWNPSKSAQEWEEVCDPASHCESKQKLPHAEVQAVPVGWLTLTHNSWTFLSLQV